MKMKLLGIVGKNFFHAFPLVQSPVEARSRRVEFSTKENLVSRENNALWKNLGF